MVGLANLCLALTIFGSIPEGNLPLEIDTQEIQVFVYSQEDKEKVVKLLCEDLDLAIESEE